ncbi:alpha/beta hydrolase fold domain-containing protein [Nocardia higoensis]|uniref:alpha/beta hydrolase fold domain-containing protein n=1 Tax=Nocardia higoensis TaxID=228599 RepID=UPI0012F629D0|nr:alpha/beta hydrolase fold domain-containing protein [Nocardia higoensis]
MATTRITEAITDAYGFASPGATIDEVRSGYDRSMSRAGLPSQVTVTEDKVAGVPGRWFEVADADVTVLFLHGGGYLFGSSVSHGPLAAHLAVAAVARVFVADYRLAPENPYPAALDDARGALAELVSNAGPGTKVVVAGDSAGGGLALATLLAAKAAGDPLPAGAVTFSAWTDLSLSSASLEERAHIDPFVDRVQLEVNAGAYLGEGNRRDPFVSPVFGDLAGLPPVHLQVGTEEVLHDDTTRFAQRVLDAGGSAEVAVQEGMPHVHQILLGLLPEAGASIETAGAFIRGLR